VRLPKGVERVRARGPDVLLLETPVAVPTGKATESRSLMPILIPQIFGVKLLGGSQKFRRTTRSVLLAISLDNTAQARISRHSQNRPSRATACTLIGSPRLRRGAIFGFVILRLLAYLPRVTQ
jgi:hypothetical protein